MRRPLALRGRRKGFSSLYGAFGVVLVSALVIGIVLADTGGDRPSSGGAQRTADLFLDTLLKSTVGNGTTLEAAVGQLCLAAPCSPGSWNRSSLALASSRLADPLASALELGYLLVVERPGERIVEVGNLGETAHGTIAGAEVFHAQDGGLLKVTAELAPLSR